MNARQAAKAAAAHIEELEDWNARATRDIKAYNACIDSMIAGGSPCAFCEEDRTGECTNENRGGKGCADWWLVDLNITKGDEANDDGKAVSESGDDSRTGTENIEGATGTLQ